MTLPKRRHFRRLDTPPRCGPVRTTDLSTGETHTDPPLANAQRRDLAKHNAKHLSTKKRHPWTTPSE